MLTTRLVLVLTLEFGFVIQYPQLVNYVVWMVLVFAGGNKLQYTSFDLHVRPRPQYRGLHLCIHLNRPFLPHAKKVAARCRHVPLAFSRAPAPLSLPPRCNPQSSFPSSSPAPARCVAPCSAPPLPTPRRRGRWRGVSSMREVKPPMADRAPLRSSMAGRALPSANPSSPSSAGCHDPPCPVELSHWRPLLPHGRGSAAITGVELPRRGWGRVPPVVAQRGGRYQPPPAMDGVSFPSISISCFCIQKGNGFELLAMIPKANLMIIQIIIFELLTFQYHGYFGEPNSIPAPPYLHLNRPLHNL